MLLYRVLLSGNKAAVATTVEAMKAIIRSSPPGRYAVEELTQEVSTSGERHWGMLVHDEDGTVELLPDVPA